MTALFMNFNYWKANTGRSGVHPGVLARCRGPGNQQIHAKTLGRL